MDYTNTAITYALLFIPASFSVALIAQGIQKMKNKDGSGKFVIAMGTILLLLIPAIYMMVTQIE